MNMMDAIDHRLKEIKLREMLKPEMPVQPEEIVLGTISPPIRKLFYLEQYLRSELQKLRPSQGLFMHPEINKTKLDENTLKHAYTLAFFQHRAVEACLNGSVFRLLPLLVFMSSPAIILRKDWQLVARFPRGLTKEYGEDWRDKVSLPSPPVFESIYDEVKARIKSESVVIHEPNTDIDEKDVLAGVLEDVTMRTLFSLRQECFFIKSDARANLLEREAAMLRERRLPTAEEKISFTLLNIDVVSSSALYDAVEHLLWGSLRMMFRETSTKHGGIGLRKGWKVVGYDTPDEDEGEEEEAAELVVVPI